MISRNDNCWCGSGKKWKKCHYPKSPPDTIQEQYFRQWAILLKTPEQIAGIREACRVASAILEKVCAKATVGVTTNALNEYAEELHREAGAIAAPKGYGHPPFPKSICTSLNEVICHGIPDDRPLQEGDILNIDVTSIVKGYYGDCSKMVAIGKISKDKQRVIDASYESLMAAGARLKPGAMIHEIGEAIEETAKRFNCSVVFQFVGHGVGVDFHEAPQVPHHRNQLKIPLAPGMTFTIEPMINLGRAEAVIDRRDQWTARTIDGMDSAQFEHTYLITDTGADTLTSWVKN